VPKSAPMYIDGQTLNAAADALAALSFVGRTEHDALPASGRSKPVILLSAFLPASAVSPWPKSSPSQRCPDPRR
jgi:hypothetical protein